MGDQEQLNERLARAAVHHRIECIEGVGRTWAVVCRVCTEDDIAHPNFGNQKTWMATCEEDATFKTLNHLARLGYVPRRHPRVVPDARSPMGRVLTPRNRYE